MSKEKTDEISHSEELSKENNVTALKKRIKENPETMIDIEYVTRDMRSAKGKSNVTGAQRAG
jgi:hypothetical protein